MGNAEYIEKYKNEDEIIRTYFQIRDRSGKLVNIDGIVNPIEIDNRQCASVVDDQGSKPHCAAYSICSLIEALNWKLTGRIVNLNADQVYAHAKLIDGDVSSEGTYLECAIKAAAKLGGFKNPDKIKIGFMYNDKSDKSIERFKYLIHKYDFVHCGFNIDTGWYACNEKDPFIKKRISYAAGMLSCASDTIQTARIFRIHGERHGAARGSLFFHGNTSKKN